MMPAKVLAIVVLPRDVGILEADVAGKPVGHYLRDRLRLLEDAEICVASRSCEGMPAWAAGYRRFAGNLPADCGPVLIIDARAWLAPGLLAKLIGMVPDRTAFVRVVETTTGGDRAAACRTLVVALGAGIFAGGAGELSDVDRVLESDCGMDATRVEASSLDAAEPSRLLDSFFALETVEQRLLHERAMSVLRAGVRLRDPRSTRIRGDLTCGAGVEIDADVIIEGAVSLGDDVRIGAHCIVRHVRIGSHTRIEPFSLVDASSIGEYSVIGPYGRIRPGSIVGDRVQIGNYVEIKSSHIGEGSRINHHSFIGDADLAAGVTIGAGTITCNHDGVGNTHTVIERGAYIGSGCNLVAPVRIGEGATVGAGSTITHDVPAAKLTLARSRQITVEGWQGPRSRGQRRT
jgi:acetyltransferase-like isoleucine patch superfamily enzyme